MQIKVSGKRSTVLKLLQALEGDCRCHVLKCTKSENWNYCGDRGDVVAVVETLDNYLDFTIVRDKRFRNLEIRITKESGNLRKIRKPRGHLTMEV